MLQLGGTIDNYIWHMPSFRGRLTSWLIIENYKLATCQNVTGWRWLLLIFDDLISFSGKLTSKFSDLMLLLMISRHRLIIIYHLTSLNSNSTLLLTFWRQKVTIWHQWMAIRRCYRRFDVKKWQYNVINW